MRSVGGTPGARRLLVFLPNWLGDVVMTTPLLADLHAITPDPASNVPVELHVAVRPAWAPLFRDDPRLAGVHEVLRGGRHGGLAGIPRLAGDWRALECDAVVLGPPSLRAALVAWLARIPVRVGHVGDGRGPLLAPAVSRAARGTRHYALEMLDLGRALRRAWGLPDAPVPTPDSRPVWAVAPGTTYGEAKTWPLNRVAELLGAAVDGGGARVVLLGDGGAREFAAALCRAGPWTTGVAWDAPADVVDLTGRTDLGQVVRILKASAAFVGNDSGLMHLAGALGVPTVGVFGSSSPAWTRPLGPRTRTVAAEGFACRPCYRKTCNQPEFCLATIGGREVFAQAAGLVAAAGERGRS